MERRRRNICPPATTDQTVLTSRTNAVRTACLLSLPSPSLNKIKTESECCRSMPGPFTIISELSRIRED